MLKLALAAAVAVPVATAGAVAATGVAVVDVREGPDGRRIVVPVPLALVQTLAALVPEGKTRIPLGREAARWLPLAHDVLAVLAQAPDAELVRVEEPGRTVLVRKEGRRLRVQVASKDEQVDIAVPIDLALALLPGSHGRIDGPRAAWALQRARFSRLVEFRGSDGGRVSVTVF